ncbi:hypothetical protein CR513_20474, partial [Mucuna pruriens]
MAAYIYVEKILIHYFQDSLTGVALSWYMSLERGWRELAEQVQPPITEKEMVAMFIDTVPSPYYDKVVGNVASNFADLMVVGERIELGIRHENFTQSNSNIGFAKKPTQKKMKGEANTVL